MAESKSNKRVIGDLLRVSRQHNRPDILQIPKRNPTLQYRWIRNTPDNITLMEAKGYHVATSDEVRAAELKPGLDGAAHRGDLILGIEEGSHHHEHKERDRELKKRRDEYIRKSGGNNTVRAGGFDFNETVKEE